MNRVAVRSIVLLALGLEVVACVAAGYQPLLRLGRQHGNSGTFAPGDLWDPRVSLVDSNGTIFVSDSSGHAKFDRSGQFVGFFDTQWFDKNVLKPRGLAGGSGVVGPDGSVYYILSQPAVPKGPSWMLRASFTGQTLSCWSIQCPSSNGVSYGPRRLFVHANGDVSISYDLPSQVVARFSGDGTLLSANSKRSAGNSPTTPRGGRGVRVSGSGDTEAFLFDAQGRLYCCAGDGTLERYTQDMVLDRLWAPLGQNNGGEWRLLRANEDGGVDIALRPEGSGASYLRTLDEDGGVSAEVRSPTGSLPQYMDSSGCIYFVVNRCQVDVYGPQ